MNNEYKEFRKLSYPYLVWLIILVFIPFLILVSLSFLNIEGVDYFESSFSLNNFINLKEPAIITAISNSVKYSVITTAICAFLGYIISYSIYKSNFKNKFLITTLFIIPMWTNLLLRSYALSNVLRPQNLLVDILSKIGININIDLIGTDFAIILGLVSTYLPFMILPVYNALEKIEKSCEEASLDLGATEFITFWKVIFPLSFKGIVTGSILVFLPSLSGFAIPKIMSDGNIVMIGNIIEESFINMNYGFGSLLAVLLLIVILGLMYIAMKVDKEGESFI
jgi:spermidine/putrescine transport system permease protein